MLLTCLLWNLFCLTGLIGRLTTLLPDKRGISNNIFGMELMGALFAFFWNGFCCLVLLCRFLPRSDKPEPSSFFRFYLIASAVLFISFPVIGIIVLIFGSSYFSGSTIIENIAESLAWLPILLFFSFLLWSPISLIAIFTAPKKYCLFPAVYLIVRALQDGLGWTAFFIPESNPYRFVYYVIAIALTICPIVAWWMSFKALNEFDSVAESESLEIDNTTIENS